MSSPDALFRSEGLRVAVDVTAAQAQLRRDTRDHAGRALVPEAGRGGRACLHLTRSSDLKGYEWLSTSPPPKHNFDVTPVITQDAHSYQKPGEEVEHVVI